MKPNRSQQNTKGDMRMLAIISAAIIALATALGAAQATGQPEIMPYLMSVSWYESRWDPQAIGDNGCSVGYVQFNQCGGMGAPYSREELLDGARNMQLLAEWIAVHRAAGYEIEDILAPWSVRWPAIRLAESMPLDATAWDWARKVTE